LILPGIRRRTLIEIAEREGIELEQRLFTVEEALQADEAFISSATTITLPVVSIDGEKIADGTPGEITRKLRKLYIKRLLEEASKEE
jgi:D-alanine transaminase